ncbi:MAG: hypothetical protein AAB383_02155 [Patescibacteria group bacterium]
MNKPERTQKTPEIHPLAKGIVSAFAARIIHQAVYVRLNPLLEFIEETEGTRHTHNGGEFVKSVVLPRAVIQTSFHATIGLAAFIYMGAVTRPHSIAPETGAAVCAYPKLTLSKSADRELDRLNKEYSQNMLTWVVGGILGDCQNIYLSESNSFLEQEKINTETLVHQDGTLSFTSTFYDSSAAPEDRLVLMAPHEDKEATEACMNAVGGEILTLQFQSPSACLWNLAELDRAETPTLTEKMDPYYITVSCGPFDLPNPNQVTNGHFQEDSYAHNPDVNLVRTPWGSTKHIEAETELRPVLSIDQP